MEHWIDKTFNWVVAQFDKISLPETKDEDFGKQGAIGFFVLTMLACFLYIVWNNNIEVYLIVIGHGLYVISLVLLIIISIIIGLFILVYISTLCGKYIILGWNKTISLFKKKQG